jgi:hypothetical protein
MKFKVTKQVCMFGVGSAVYYPGDIVEGPAEWVKTNPFLEPIPEPVATLAPRVPTVEVVPVVLAVSTVSDVAATVKTEEPKPKEEKKVEPEERHATAHRSGKER